MIYLSQDKIASAFALISSLLQKYPQNAYLNRLLAYSLYRIVDASQNGNLPVYIPSYKSVDNDLKETHFILRKFKKEELHLVALRYAWDCYAKVSKSSDSKVIFDKLLTSYVENYKQNLAIFADPAGFNDSIVDRYYSNEDDASTDRKNRKRPRYRFEQSLSYYALSDVKTDPAFKKSFDDASSQTKNKTIESKEKNKEENKEDDDEYDEEDDKDANKSAKTVPKKTALTSQKGKKDRNKLLIDSIILLEPQFVLIDTRRKRVKSDYLSNEEYETRLRRATVDCAVQANIALNMFNANDIDSSNIQKFNDYCVLKEYVNEFFNRGVNESTLSPDYARLREIGDRYSTRYVSIMVNRNLIERRKTNPLLVALSIVQPGFGVFYLLTRFIPRTDFLYVVAVIDMYDGKLVYGTVLDFNRRETMDLFKSQMYATFIQLKGKRK